MPLTSPNTGSAFLDIYPEGVMRLTRPTGQSVRNVITTWSEPCFVFQFNADSMRGLFTPSSSQLNLRSNSGSGPTLISDTPVTVAMRKG